MVVLRRHWLKLHAFESLSNILTTIVAVRDWRSISRFYTTFSTLELCLLLRDMGFFTVYEFDCLDVFDGF